MDRPARPSRVESREISELKELKSRQPELATAADLQIALLESQRHVQSRIPIPWIETDIAWLHRQQELGKPLLRFEDLPLDWTDVRLMFRETSEILCRFEAIDRQEHEQLQALTREGDLLQRLVIDWYNAAAAPDRVTGDRPDSLGPAFDQVALLAMRPFLARCADAAQQRTDLSSWRQGSCPLCGGEPEFGVITRSAERLLICSRCTGRWPYHALACPFCGNDARERVTSFTSRDGLYRIYACDVCRRYLKAYDSRHASRPVIVEVDTIATLPLDAAAMKKGYTA